MPEENKTKPHYTLHGRRWFDRINGNTYHTVECFKGSEFLFKTPMIYGYGDHYRYTGISELMKRGEISASINNPAWHYKDQILFIVSDVTRKKDL